MDLSGVNFRPLRPLLVPHWRGLLQGGRPLQDLLDFSALLATNGSIVNRLFREARVPAAESAGLLSLRYSRKKAADKRNQRVRDRGALSGLSGQLALLQETKRTLQRERHALLAQIQLYRDLACSHRDNHI